MPPFLLRLGDHMQRQRGLARAFRAINLDDATARQAADAQRDIEPQRAGGDRLDLTSLGWSPSRIDRPLAKGAVDLCSALHSSAFCLSMDFASFSVWMSFSCPAIAMPSLA
jgi:hypothetical protein